MSIKEQLWTFLNSDFGLLVSSFFLVTVAGTFLTTWYKRESKKHEVRFVQLHQERAKAIKTFHDRTYEVKNAIHDLNESYFINFDPDYISPEEVKQKVTEYIELSDEYKIFFSKKTCDHINSIRGNFYVIWSLLEARMSKTNEAPKSKPPELVESDRIYLSLMFSRLDKLIESLRHDFRRILGVD
jgi:hypothetical protein